MAGHVRGRTKRNKLPSRTQLNEFAVDVGAVSTLTRTCSGVRAYEKIWVDWRPINQGAWMWSDVEQIVICMPCGARNRPNNNTKKDKCGRLTMCECVCVCAVNIIDFHVTCVSLRAVKGFLRTLARAPTNTHIHTLRRSLLHFCDFVAIGLCRRLRYS